MQGLEHLQKTIEQEKLNLQSMEAQPDVFSKLEKGALKAYIAYHEEVLKGVTEGKKLVLYTLGHSPEIFWAMDLIPVEVSALVTLIGGTQEEAIERYDRIENEFI